MKGGDYIVRATLVNAYCDNADDELAEDATFSIERDGDNLAVTYEATGNVDAICHAESLIRDLEEWGIECDEIRLAAVKS